MQSPSPHEFGPLATVWNGGGEARNDVTTTRVGKVLTKTFGSADAVSSALSKNLPPVKTKRLSHCGRIGDDPTVRMQDRVQ